MSEHNTNRAAAVAGRFYSSDPDTLLSDLETIFQKSAKLAPIELSDNEELRAIIVPHAGYVFSGVVAASAYNTILSKKNLERIFIIGSSHHASFHGASIYSRGDYNSPLGIAKVDKETAGKLLENQSVFQFIPEVHIPEHSVEVQIPFLQYLLGSKFKIIPIIIGTMSIEVCSDIAEILTPYFNENNLFIFSTDLSHYPEYNDAVKIDHKTIEILCQNDPLKFHEYLHETDRKSIPNLMTGMCGWTSIITLLYLTTGNSSYQYTPILYQNSGDIPIYGEKRRVVGYQSIMITQLKKSSSRSIVENADIENDKNEVSLDETDEKHLDIQTDGILA